MRVLMVGATGRHAHLVLPELKQRGVEVRALVRNEERAQVARQPRGGYGRYRRCLPHRPGALGGGGADGTGDGPRGPVRRRAKVRVFRPDSLVDRGDDQPRRQAAGGEALYSSELDFTVLQPAPFMQNFEQSWTDIVEHDRLAQPYSLSSKMCSVNYRDVAEVAAMAMTGDELSYGTFELCAPGMQDTYDTAAILSEVLGRPISAVQTSLEQFASRLPEGPFRAGMSRMMAHYDRHGLPGGNSVVLRAILGREPRLLRDYFEELASR